MLFWSWLTVAGDTDKSPWWSHDHMSKGSPTVFMTGPAFLCLQSITPDPLLPPLCHAEPGPGEICIGLFAKLTLRSIKHSNLKWALVPLWNSRHISVYHLMALLHFEMEGERVPIFRASSSNSIKSFGLKQTHIFEFYIFHNGPVHPQKIVFINFYGLNVPRILWPWRRMKSEKWQNKKTLLEHYWFVVTALMGNYYFQ